MMSEPLLQIKSISKHFGAVAAADNLDLEVQDNELHALIGPNGAGKTTLIGQILGELKPDSGRICFAGTDITALDVHERVRLGLGRTYQVTTIFPDFNVRNNVILAILAKSGRSYGLLRSARTDPALVAPALEALEQVGLSARADEKAARLSHGEQRQLELAMALALEPKLLLLDEPMAGMGLEDGRRMIGYLKNLKGSIAMLLIEHDMDAVFALADRISVLVYGHVIACGSPQMIRQDKNVREAYLGYE
jgi:branched-chain amino acid transport system ATP-binding protein